MAIQWFYQSSEGQPAGPIDSRELRRLAEDGIVMPGTLVRQGAGTWVRADQVRGLFQPSKPSSPGASPVTEASEKLPWPVTWAAIIVGSGTVLLLLWAMVFRGTPQQQVDQPRLVQPAAGWELAILAEVVGPSVVQVNVTAGEEGVTGSGFVLDKQGTICTNYHVIEDATAGRVVFSDKTSAPITGYLGVWPEKDIALVQVECPPAKLHPLRLAPSAPRQGERVAAFGSPLGLQQSVSEGIVGAVRESSELRTLGPVDIDALLIQTTTPISHGNSGGPLVDMRGMVVGVNTWTFRPMGGENLNFSVAAVELPPLLLAKHETPSPLPATDTATDDVQRIVRRAWGHLMAQDYDRAITDFSVAIQLDPSNADAYSGRGVAYVSKDDYDSAISDLSQAIRLDPKFSAAYLLRGLAYQATGQPAAAERDFARAKELGYEP